MLYLRKKYLNWSNVRFFCREELWRPKDCNEVCHPGKFLQPWFSKLEEILVGLGEELHLLVKEAISHEPGIVTWTWFSEGCSEVRIQVHKTQLGQLVIVCSLLSMLKIISLITMDYRKLLFF